jgi:AmmeMemoRadiSam system protein B
MGIRNPVVAGKFYSGTKESLVKEVSGHIDGAADKEECYGAISPHAGYIYSGAVAGRVLSRVKLKSGVIILGPNHTGEGARFALASNNRWRTPIGDVPIDAALSKTILEHAADIEEDDSAHAFEHSIEVLLPFLQVVNENFSFVPISIGETDIDLLKRAGRSIADAVLAYNKGVTVITSSDMTHYESAKAAKAKDKIAIDAIIELDEDRLIEEVAGHNISMCGVAPTIVMITALKALGAKKAELVSYATSGDISGDNSNVVGYAGLLVK